MILRRINDPKIKSFDPRFYSIVIGLAKCTFIITAITEGYRQFPNSDSKIINDYSTTSYNTGNSESPPISPLGNELKLPKINLPNANAKDESLNS